MGNEAPGPCRSPRRRGEKFKGVSCETKPWRRDKSYTKAGNLVCLGFPPNSPNILEGELPSVGSQPNIYVGEKK